MAWFNLGRALDRKDWSIRTFAEKLGVEPKTLSRYFKPGFDPNASTLLKWKQALGCTLDELIDENLSEHEKHMPHPQSALQFLGSMKKPTAKKAVKKRSK